MKLIDLSGQWNVKLDDNSIYHVNLPGTLDENSIGFKDNNSNQWQPAEVTEDDNNNALLHKSDLILTRLTRAYSYEGTAIFTKLFSFKGTPYDNRVFLEVERTRKLAIKINGYDIEPYSCGTLSTPYIYEITNSISDKTIIELICDNSYKNWPRSSIIYSSAATDETQTNWNGILGYLQLRFEKKVFLASIRVYPNNTLIKVIVEIDASEPYEGIISLDSPVLESKIDRRVSVEAGKNTFVFEDIPIKNGCKYWDEYEGNLYELCVSGDGLVSKKVSFGIRDFRNGKGRFSLNGRNIFLRSDTNCCVFPETGHMPLTEAEWLTVMEIYKSYGINCVRFHSHCPPEAAFSAADRMGILMQPELSHWNPKTAFEDEESWSYYSLELKQILLTYANHPSFVMLTMGNELQANELGHQRMDKLIYFARGIDSTRMYANGSNVHYGALGTDATSDFYTSSNLYDLKIRGTSSMMAGHINDSYPNSKTNYNDVMNEIRKEFSGPVFSFEVGQYEILPDFDEINCFKGITIPDNLKKINNDALKKGFYLNWKKRVEATGELARISYREEIEAALRTKGISGISLLGLQDFPGQGTALVGMLNSHFQPKPYDFAQPEKFKTCFKNVLPLVLLDKYTYTNKEELTAIIQIANYGKNTITAPTIYELSDGSMIVTRGIIPAVEMPCGGITEIGQMVISLKDIKISQKLILTVSIEGNKNDYPIWVYQDFQMDDFKDITITRTLADTDRELTKGKSVLYSPPADENHFPKSIQSQFTTDFWSVGTFANQSGCMGYLIDSSHPVFSRFPTETHTNWQWWPMTKARAIIIPDEIKPIITVIDCYARLRRLASLFECKVGNGRLMISSMGLLEKQEYPEVRALTYSILNYMNSKEFVPNQEIGIETLRNILQ